MSDLIKEAKEKAEAEEARKREEELKRKEIAEEEALKYKSAEAKDKGQGVSHHRD